MSKKTKTTEQNEQQEEVQEARAAVAVAEPDTSEPDTAPEAEEEIVQVPPQDLAPNPHQPRRDFNQQDLEDLQASIEEHGVLQPLLARMLTTGPELISGERRKRAAIMAGRKTVPVIFKHGLTDKQVAEMALVENVQRQNISYLDEALAYKRLRNEFGMTAEEIAKKCKRNGVSSIYTGLRVADLPEQVHNQVRESKLTYSHAAALTPLALYSDKGDLLNEDEVLNKADDAEAFGWTVEALQTNVREVCAKREEEEKERKLRENPPLALEETPATAAPAAPAAEAQATQASAAPTPTAPASELPRAGDAPFAVDDPVTWKDADSLPRTGKIIESMSGGTLFKVRDDVTGEVFSRVARFLQRVLPEAPVAATEQQESAPTTEIAAAEDAPKCQTCGKTEAEVTASGAHMTKHDLCSNCDPEAQAAQKELAEGETKEDAPAVAPKPDTTPAAATPKAPEAPAPAAPSKAPAGFINAMVPTADYEYLRDAGVGVPQALTLTRRVVALAKDKGMQPDDVLATIESYFND